MKGWTGKEERKEGGGIWKEGRKDWCEGRVKEAMKRKLKKRDNLMTEYISSAYFTHTLRQRERDGEREK